jgi:8-oxo-dGTP diphosphatase
VSSEPESDAFIQPTIPPQGIPVSAGAMIFDRGGRLLILKPTYKSGWTIPGGVMEADGETPWDACRREVREETGLEVESGRLAAMDPVAGALTLLRGPIRRRVRQASRSKHLVYLEDGRRVPGVHKKKTS